MKTAQKIVNNLINISLRAQLIKTTLGSLGITSLCQNTHFTYKIFQYTCFNWTYYTCSYIKWVCDMSQLYKASNFQYARYQRLAMDLHFDLLQWASISTMDVHICNQYSGSIHLMSGTVDIYLIFLHINEMYDRFWQWLTDQHDNINTWPEDNTGNDRGQMCYHNATRPRSEFSHVVIWMQ